jgi:CRP-like cAMP-binding protein/Zn-dependent protease
MVSEQTTAAAPGLRRADGKNLWAGLRDRLNPAAYRPVRSPAATAVPLTTRRGQPYYILVNRDRARYLRLSPEDHYLWTLMDGTRAVKDLIFQYFMAFGALAFDRVAQLVWHLRLEHMLADRPVNVFALVRRHLAGSRRTIMHAAGQLITGQRQFRIHRIDALIDGLHRRGGWLLYTTPMQVLYAALVLAGGWLFVQHLRSGRYDLFQTNGSYGLGLALLALLNYFSISVHELSHALTCKHYGARVNSAGVMLYYGLPAYFIDTTDVWTRPSRARIATSWAGPYSGLILAGLAAIVVQAAPGSAGAPILHRLSFLWTLTLLFNLIPLLELDGYFILVDWLEIPMLRARALAFVRRDLWRKLRTRERLTGEERFLGWFGALSLAFSLLIVGLALGSWQYRLKALTQALWGGNLGSKALLVLLLMVLSLPLGMSLGSSAVAATRAAARWTRSQTRLPRGHTVRQREQLLRAVRFLSPLSADEVRQVALRMRRQAFRAGDVVLRQGEAGDRFYVIERGVAEVYVDGGAEPIRHLVRGDYFGEIALLERAQRSATVRAGSRLVVLSVARGDFDRLLAAHISAPGRIAARIHACQALQEFAIFAALSSRELDDLASRLSRHRVAPGEVVFREGDTGNAFYLIESGQAEVALAGRPGVVLHRGEYFGEIALLFDIPRTATVRALTPLDLLVLARPDFDALVATSLHKVMAAIEDVGRERLAGVRGPAAAGRGLGG